MPWLALYLATGILVALGQPESGPAPWYPPVAVGIAMYQFIGRRWWPVVLVFEIVITVLQYRLPIGPALLVAGPSVVEGLVGAVLVQRLRLIRLDAPEHVLGIAAVALVTPVAGATLGELMALLTGAAASSPLQWLQWVTGDATAIASILPLLLLTGHGDLPEFLLRSRRVTVEGILAGLVTIAVVATTSVVSAANDAAPNFRFVWTLPVLWAALRAGRLATTCATVAMAATSFIMNRALGLTPSPLEEAGGQLAVVAIGLGGLAVAISLHGRRVANERLAGALGRLEQSEHRYATLFGASPNMQLLLDAATGIVVDVNEAAARFYGHAREEIIGTQSADYSLAEPGVVQARLEEAKSGEVNHMVGRHRTAGGVVRTVEIRTGLVRIGDRALVHLVVRDVTAELEARAENARLASAFESSAEAIVTTDLGGLITGWNRAAEDLYGYPRDEALGRHVDSVLGPVEMTAQQVSEAARRGDSLLLGHVVRRAADGAEIPVDLTISPIVDDSRVVGMSRISHDMRRIIEGQARVRRSEAMLADAAAIGGMGSWEWDSVTERTRWSAQLYRIMGVPDDFDVSRYHELIHPDDRAAVEAAMGALSLEAVELPFRVVRPDGTERSVIARWRSIIEANDLERQVGVIRDVTEERALEAQLRQAQRLESIGLLAGGVAHDFNNLLTAIGGFTELARMGAAEGRSPDEELEQVQAAVARAQSLTQQLLAFGRRAIVRPRPVDVAQAVDDLVPMLRRLLGEQVTIQTQLERGAATVIDPGALDQVLVNLAVNARDAMPSGGTLRISVGTAADPTADAGFHTWIEVEDDGVGIPAERLEQIFLPFFTTKERGQGTGLGLSTVQGIVAMAGGIVDVESSVGQGTRFRIVLPGLAGAVPVAAPVAPVIREAGSGCVLFVEDEALVRRVGERVLQEAGFRVLTAANVPDALALAERERPDILVSDIVLPGISDGIALADALRTRWPDLPVLLTTGYTERRPPEWASLLMKPYDVDVLVAHVRGMLDEAASVRAAGGAATPDSQAPTSSMSA